MHKTMLHANVSIRFGQHFYDECTQYALHCNQQLYWSNGRKTAKPQWLSLLLHFIYWQCICRMCNLTAREYEYVMHRFTHLSKQINKQCCKQAQAHSNPINIADKLVCIRYYSELPLGQLRARIECNGRFVG